MKYATIILLALIPFSGIYNVDKLVHITNQFKLVVTIVVTNY